MKAFLESTENERKMQISVFCACCLHRTVKEEKVQAHIEDIYVCRFLFQALSADISAYSCENTSFILLPCIRNPI